MQNPAEDVTEEELRKIYEDAYKDEQFVRFLNAGVCPETRWVEGSNYVDVNVKLDERTHRVIMMGAMDNLVKGAAETGCAEYEFIIWSAGNRRTFNASCIPINNYFDFYKVNIYKVNIF